MNKAGHKVIILRSRPSILPILSSYIYGKAAAEKKTTSSLPREGKNKSKLSSWVRFFYYFFDYIFGQFYVYFKFLRKGINVIYDRYYYDYIVDPKRANLREDFHYPKWFSMFIIEPNVNILLYASVHEILSRKKELNMFEIESLTSKYQKLFTKRSINYPSSVYLNIENTNIEKTLKTIIEAIEKKLY